MIKKLSKNRVAAGVFFSLIYFFVNLFVINDYGVTWDFTYHYNAGLWHLNLPLTDAAFVMGPSPPLSDMLPVVSKLIFSDYLGFLPWDSAYNLYSVFLGSIGVGIVFIIVDAFVGGEAAFFSAVSLALMPRYIGHLHGNMKDIPQAVFFTLTAGLIFLMIKKPSIKIIILTSLAFAFSYNSKVNAVFLLIIYACFLTVLFFLQKIYKDRQFPAIRKSVFLFPFTALLFALSLWSVFWPEPLLRLREAFHSYTSSTTNMPILYFGNIVRSGQNVPWHYPYGILSATTPIIISVFFLVGLIFLILNFLKEKKLFYLYLLFWFFIPLARYLKPQMIVIDDIRHFMEVVFPFAIISGIGASHIFYRISKKISHICKFFSKRHVLAFFSIIYAVYLLVQNILYHPYQMAYFSESVGGIQEAQNNFDIDFWGISYKNAMAYLNKNAVNDARITTAMIPDIAKLYLRQDLKQNLNSTNMTYAKLTEYKAGDYTVILNRKSFFDWYNVKEYFNQNSPVYNIQVQSVPLLFIFEN